MAVSLHVTDIDQHTDYEFNVASPSYTKHRRFKKIIIKIKEECTGGQSTQTRSEHRHCTKCLHFTQPPLDKQL